MATYLACSPTFCLADAAVAADFIGRLAAARTVNVTFTSLNGGKRITVPVPLTGFGDAADALGLARLPAWIVGLIFSLGVKGRGDTMARKHFLAAGLISCAVLPGALYADGPLPSDPVIVMGDITISSPADLRLLLQQSGAAGIIDCGSFSIADGYGVSFQNGNGATLNRVTGGDLAQVMASLDATGSVFLINQNGIIIGKTGEVNTGDRFVASALDIGNEDFRNGGDNVFAGNRPA